MVFFSWGLKSKHFATLLIPELPGIQNIFLHLGDFFIAQQIACSLAPEPKTSIFKINPFFL